MLEIERIEDDRERMVTAFKITEYARAMGFSEEEIAKALIECMDLTEIQARNMLMRTNAQWN